MVIIVQLIRLSTSVQPQSIGMVLITLLFLTACAKEDDTEKIRALIKEGAKLAEEHSAAGLLELTTGDFIARPGEHDGREVRRILWFAFNHYGNFKVMYPETVSILRQVAGRHRRKSIL